MKRLLFDATQELLEGAKDQRNASEILKETKSEEFNYIEIFNKLSSKVDILPLH